MTVHPGDANPWSRQGAQPRYEIIPPQPAPQNTAPGYNPNYGPVVPQYGYPQAPHMGYQYDPTRVQARPNKRKLSTAEKATAIVGGVAVAVAGLGLAAYEGLKGNSVHSNNPAVVGPEVPGPESPSALVGDTNHDGEYSEGELKAMSPSEVASVDPKYLVAVYGPENDQYRQQTYDIEVQIDNLTDLEKSVCTVPTGPKADYSDQDVLNQVTLDAADASLQPDHSDGGRMIALPYSPEVGNFQTIQNQIINGENILSIYKVDDESYPHVEGETFATIDISGYEQVRVIKQQLLPNKNSDGEYHNANQYGLYGLVKNGDAESWQQIHIFTLSDNNFNSALTTLLATVGRQP